MPVRLLLFEDNPGLRETLVQFVHESDTHEVVGAYAHCDNWRELMANHSPDVIIMDIEMPGIGGMRGVREIKTAMPQAKVIMYTVFDDDERIFDCLCFGANGYILKNTSLQNLIDGVDEVMNGGAMMSPYVAARAISFFSRSKQVNYSYGLSARETEILHLLARGKTYKRIAQEANISAETVKKHLKNVYTKLQVGCGTEAVAKALRESIIQLD